MTTRDSFNIELIEKNFEQIAPRLDEITMYFYADLFDSHPELRPFFGKVALVAQRQKMILAFQLILI